MLRSAADMWRKERCKGAPFRYAHERGLFEAENSRSIRWELTRRVIALDPVIDQVMGEDSHLRYRSWELQAAVDALFTALSAWRTVANHLELLPYEQRPQFPPTRLGGPSLGGLSSPLRPHCRSR